MFIGFSIEQTMLGEFKVIVPDIKFAVFYIPNHHNLKYSVKNKIENHIKDLFRHNPDLPMIHVSNIEKLYSTNPDVIWSIVEINIDNQQLSQQKEMF